MFTETARAKINLNLHVGSLVEDPAHKYFGYHPLSSVVAFANIGDELSCEQSPRTNLTITGPFSQGLETDDSNLVLRAYDKVAKRAPLPSLAFHLEKNLPIASGIGGGSSDAAAALKLLKNYAKLPEEIWQEIARDLGADVPVCLRPQTVLMTGIGENLQALPGFGEIHGVLVNPGQKVSTARIFALFDQANEIQPIQNSPLDISKTGRNDLQAHAIGLLPDIEKCLEALALQNDCSVQRMSGSGATCFGFFGTAERAKTAARKLSDLHPDWWIKDVVIGDEN